MDIKAVLLLQGPGAILYYIAEGKRCRFTSFILGLANTQRSQILRVLDQAAKIGVYRNQERFKHQRGKVFAFKHAGAGVRIYAFMGENVELKKVYVLTHGVVKKKDKADEADLDRADRLRREFFAGGAKYVRE